MLSRLAEGTSSSENDSELSVLVYSDTSRAAVMLHGQLDMATAPKLENALQGLRRQGCLHIQLDFAAITFVDATGLGVLLRASEAMATHRGRLLLRNLSRQARRLVSVSGTSESLVFA